MLPPRVSPRERITSKSFVKPKVRARAISRLYWPEPMNEDFARAKLTAVVIVILIEFIELTQIGKLSEPRHHHNSIAVRRVSHDDKLTVFNFHKQARVVIESHVRLVRRSCLAQELGNQIGKRWTNVESLAANWTGCERGGERRAQLVTRVLAYLG